MRAWAYQGAISLANLQEVERQEPQARPGEVILRMRAVALNYRDLAIARGHYHVGVEAPLIPLSDGAGEVVSLGAGVKRFKVGDLACPVYMPDWLDGPVTPAKARRRLGGPTDGVMQTLMRLKERELVRAPAHLSPEEAATLPVAAVTAWASLFEKTTVAPGQRVFVNGAGGVSTAAIQLANAAGAEVICGARALDRADALKALGAAHVVAMTPGWPSDVARLSAGGVDLAVDVVGGARFGDTIQATKPGGHVHLIGYAGGTTAQFDMFDAIRRATTIHIGTGGSRASFEALVRAVETSRLSPAICQVLPAARITEAMEALARGGHVGKIVLTLP